MEEYRSIIRNFIIENFDIDKNDKDFTDDVNLFEYGYIDSLGFVKIVVFMENTFNFKVENKDLMMYPTSTINEIASLISRKVESK